MDLGIKNKKAIVCASSKGLGKACARSLMMEGVSVVINARGEESLKETFEELSLIDENKVSMTVADLNTEEGRARARAIINNLTNRRWPGWHQIALHDPKPERSMIPLQCGRVNGRTDHW